MLNLFPEKSKEFLKYLRAHQVKEELCAKLIMLSSVKAVDLGAELKSTQ